MSETATGTPLADIDPTTPASALQNHCGQDKSSNPAAEAGAKRIGKARDNLTTIRFVRSRILYARAALNARGRVRFGLRHIRTTCTSSFANPTKSCRRLQQAPGSRVLCADNSCDEIHLSSAIWPPQRLHVQDRPQGDISSIQRLHVTRKRNCICPAEQDYEARHSHGQSTRCDSKETPRSSN